MKNISKIQMFLKAAVVIAVALAFVMPVSVAVTNTTQGDEKTQNTFFGDSAIQRDIEKVYSYDSSGYFPLGEGVDVRLTGEWNTGDDILPSVTRDDDGRSIVTWTDEIGIGEATVGYLYSETPTDPASWLGGTYMLTGLQELRYSDIGTCEHSNYDLMGVFLGMDTEEAGGVYFGTITDDSTWEFYTWTGGAPEPKYTQIADGGWYADLNYPDVIGPFNFYIYREIYDVYDIVDCPVCFHTGIDAASGVGYFDAQSGQLTAPASDPDMVNFEDRFHTVVQYNDPAGPAKIVWKKVVPAEQPDYEYTPYQDTIANGTNPAIAAYETDHVAIAYVDNGTVKCIYSDDDGETWDTSTVATGEFPDIVAIHETFFCSYIDGGNLYVVNSTDGGSTWGSPTQINDEAGTVVAEENSVDMHYGGIVWVDSRNEDYDLYYDQFFTPPPEPHLVLGEISGGLGISAVITNDGDTFAADVEMTIHVVGGILGLIDVEVTETIASVDVGEEASVSTGIIFGLGTIEIAVTASAPGANSVEGGAEGTQFIIFSMVN